MPPRPSMIEELEAGFYHDFERGWRKAELVGRALMVVAAGLTLGGVLGGGPVSLWTRTARGGSLQVDYAPVVRFGTPTGLTLRAAPDGGQRKITVTLPKGIVSEYGLQSVFPQPSEWTTGDDGDIRMVFDTAPGREAAIQVGGLPTGGGSMRLSARLADGPAAEWSQLVLP